MNKKKLLTREQFRDICFKRDNFRCIFCNNENIVVHHIIDRSLFKDGGYYLDNGVSVCEKHHWDCEKTDISVENVRHACGIKNIIIPDDFETSKCYDKWGNVILLNGKRLPGPIFLQENVQKILKDKLYLFK